jgi:hypothetical protein
VRCSVATGYSDVEEPGASEASLPDLVVVSLDSETGDNRFAGVSNITLSEPTDSPRDRRDLHDRLLAP